MPAFPPHRDFTDDVRAGGIDRVAALDARLDASGDASVYGAEEVAQQDACCDDWNDLAPGEVATFAAQVLNATGWQHHRPPVFVFDVSADSRFTAWHQGATGTIHLDPRYHTPRWVVLHEMAHWLKPTEGHGASFTTRMAELVRVGYSDDVAAVLLQTYADFGVDVDLLALDPATRALCPDTANRVN